MKRRVLSTPNVAKFDADAGRYKVERRYFFFFDFHSKEKRKEAITSLCK